jgi:hypothetical protein
MASIERKAIDKVFILLGVFMTIVLVVMGAIAWYGYQFATSTVTTELSQQKVYFPEKGSPAITSLPSVDQEKVAQYAGQQLVNGDQAKVYADNFINIHLSKIANGMTYAQVSAAAAKDPSNTTLQQQKTLLFQGETLRGLLLGSGYAYWTFGIIAMYASWAAFASAVVMALFVLLGLRHLAKN